MKTKLFFLSFLLLPTFLYLEEHNLMQDSLFLRAKEMSLEERAYQVMMVNIPSSKEVESYIRKEFTNGMPGAILLFKQNLEDTPQNTAKYIATVKGLLGEIASKNSLEQIMPLIALDNEGGNVFRTSKLTTRLPSARDVANKMTASEAEELFFILGRQMKIMGIDFNLAPVVECETDLNKEFLKNRTFSASTEKTVQFANAFIKGMNKAGLLCSIKHFPGNGADDPHGGGSTLSCTKEEFDRIYLAPFERILNENHYAISILLSHVSFPTIDLSPFCLSKKGIQNIIRGELKFNSLLLTDDISMGALKKRGASADNAVLALESGADMIMCSERKISVITKAIVEKAKKDKNFEQRLTEAAFHVLRAKQDVVELDEKKMQPLEFDEEMFYELKQKGDSIVDNFFGAF